jgi:putative endonuclease
MTKQIILGDAGEEMAKALLLKKGYQILETKWRNGRGEIDLIAKDKDTLVFVEVKTRSSDAVQKPEQAVGRQKQRLMVQAAVAYANQIQHDWEIRFDVVAITNYTPPPKIEHFEDAFYPDWTWR